MCLGYNITHFNDFIMKARSRQYECCAIKGTPDDRERRD
jgi:hypothetical protein